MTKPMVFTIEGIDGTGKSSLVSSLKERLGDDCIIAHDPGDTVVGDALKAIVKDKTIPMSSMSQILCFTASRFELAQQVIMPALKAGKHVILDRWWPSTYAYQTALDPSNADLIMQLNDDVMMHNTHKIIAYPVTIILDASLPICMSRINSRGNVRTDRFEQIEFLKVVKGNYRDLATTFSYPVIDASQNPRDVEAQVWREIQEYF